jgi:4'-phosphopantetheinyl transferase
LVEGNSKPDTTGLIQSYYVAPLGYCATAMLMLRLLGVFNTNAVDTSPLFLWKQSLDPDDVHIWLATPAACDQPELVRTYLAWLDQEERSRYERFRLPHHRHEYLVAHALLRSALSYYGGDPPEKWSFVKNPYGRPEIDPESGLLPLRFNLSHTAGLVACAVTRSAAVGIDVENIARSGDLNAIAKTICTSEELADLNSRSDQAWYQHFFGLWTLKEAYTKAIGKGLSMPLQQITFRVHRRTSAIQFQQLGQVNQTGRPSNFHFALGHPTSSHCLALAVEMDPSPNLVTRWVVPNISGDDIPLSYCRS